MKNPKKLKLILDTNMIISALINENSIIRDILVSNKVEFYTPEFVMKEVEKHLNEILVKSGLDEMRFRFVLGYLTRKVNIIKKEGYNENLLKARDIMKDIDICDSEFLALAMSIPNDGIFSNDSDFDKTGVKRWTVKNILDKLGKSKI